MGIYLNPGTIEFQESINSEIYVDKTMLIERTNAALRTKQKYVCISRPRRFGKSMAANMLTGYNIGKSRDCTRNRLPTVFGLPFRFGLFPQ